MQRVLGPALPLLSLSLLASLAALPSAALADSGRATTSNSVYLYAVRKDFFTGPAELTLECSTRLDGVQFWWEIGGKTESVTVSFKGRPKVRESKK